VAFFIVCEKVMAMTFGVSKGPEATG